MRDVILAFFGGVVVGAVTALLLAPQSGKETREDIKNFVTEAEDKIRRKYDEIVEEGKKQIDKIKDKAHTIVEEGKRVLHKDKESKA